MANGIEIRLYNGATARASVTGITALWWDQTDVYDFDSPVGRTDAASTDIDGDLILDLSGVSGLAVGDWGYLVLRKEDGADHKDSLVFQGRVQVSNITGGTKLVYDSGWTRPSDWLAHSDVTGGNKISAIHSVYKGAGNLCAFQCTLSTGGYIVNWGDGSAPETVASGVTAQHAFDYDDLAGNSEVGIADARSCTFQDTGDTVTLSGHGFQDGTEISFSSITSTTGISTYTRYWVRDVSGSTFKVAATKGGSALALTTDGSGSVYIPDYRQALVVVTPETTGNFLTLNLALRHSGSSAVRYSTGWTSIDAQAASMTSCTLYDASAVRNASLVEFSLRGHSITNFSSFFRDCYALQSIPLLNTASVTNFSYCFRNCYSLRSIPLINTASATDFSYCFSNCSSLRSIPLLNTASATTFSNCFNGCYALQSIPLLNTASVTNFSYCFNGCSSLKSIPLLNTASSTNFGYCFYDCSSLKSIPLLNTASVTTFSNCFNGCYALRSIPLLNTASATTFSNCFYNCYTLQSIPLLNFSSATNVTSYLSSCTSLQRAAVTGLGISHNMSNMSLSGTALDEVYTNLPTVASGTITVTGNYGTATHTPSIATAKGWTVTA